MNRVGQFFRQRPKRLLFIAVCITGLVLVAATRWQFSRSISRVNVQGTSLLRQSEIVDIVLQAKTALPLTSRMTAPRMPKTDINTSEIEQRIEKHPFVKHASVFIGASDALTVELEERVPIAYLMMKGKQYYLDAEGRVLPYRLTESVLDLPVIAASGRMKLDSARLAEVIETVRAIQAFDKEHEQTLYQSLSEIDVLPGGEFQFRLTACPTPIRFGTAENKEVKIARIAAFMRHCARPNSSVAHSFSDCKYVDVRWEHQIVVMPFARNVAIK